LWAIAVTSRSTATEAEQHDPGSFVTPASGIRVEDLTGTHHASHGHVENEQVLAPQSRKSMFDGMVRAFVISVFAVTNILVLRLPRSAGAFNIYLDTSSLSADLRAAGLFIHTCWGLRQLLADDRAHRLEVIIAAA
jgi:hypothetical protein